MRSLLYSLVAADVGLILLHLILKAAPEHQPWGLLEEVFDLDEEISIPTWFSSIKLFTIAAVAALAALNNDRRAEVPNWLLIAGAGAFLLLSMDEGAMLHERFTAVSRRLGLDFLVLGERHGAWILPYAFLCLVALLIAHRPLIRIVKAFPEASRAAIIGATLLVVGAVGLEAVSYYALPERDGFWYELEVAGEEGLEMIGASLILYGVLRLSAGIARRTP